MPCPACAATATTGQPQRTGSGYRTCRCCRCRRVVSTRTSDTRPSALPVVLWRLRYTLRLRDRAELSLERGFVFGHEAVRD